MASNLELGPGPYFNRKYWDGHTFGEGDTKPLVKTPYDNTGARSASEFLLKYLESGPISRPVRKFKDGETFSVEEHRSGTIIVYGREWITNTTPADPEHLDECAELPLPQRPGFESYYDLMLGDSQANMPLTLLTDDHGTYGSSMCLGAVVTGVDLKPSLMTIAAEMGPSTLRTTGPISDELSAFTIGEVDHFQLPNGADWIQRVNVLELAVEG